MSTVTYPEALQYLYRFINYETRGPTRYDSRTFNLDRLRRLLGLLGHPEQQLRCVHIAGTKGKSSTAAMTASIVQHAGYRAGLYTSPHLLTYRERIVVNGQPISKAQTCRLVTALQPHVARLATDPEVGAPSFFDLWTALAFLFFAEQCVDVAVLEVGLGGRLDSTNVINGVVSIITPIGLDHTALLGHTVAAIGLEKAGIIKTAAPVVSGPQVPEAQRVIAERCRITGSTLYQVVEDGDEPGDIRWTRTTVTDAGQTCDFHGLTGTYSHVAIPLLGVYQVANAAAAIGAAELLAPHGLAVSAQSIHMGLQSLQWPGRMQVVGERPYVVLDGAHNAMAVQMLLRTLPEVFVYDRCRVVMAILEGHLSPEMCRALGSVADQAIITRVRNRRSLAPALLAEHMRPYTEVVMAPTLPDALALALASATPDDLVCVTGSLYIVGEALEVVHHLEPEEVPGW